jgi:macrolide phosphotransferase
VARSPLALAALATDAIPGLDVHDVRVPAHAMSGTDTAIVIDAEGTRWMIRAPQNPAGGAALEAEIALLDSLVFYVDAGRLPFDVPRPAGFTPLAEGGRAVVHKQIAGRVLQLGQLGPGPGLAAALGRAIAALHELPVSTIEDTGLPVYTPDEYRRRRLAEVDEAAKTGLVPTTLLRRWERALEDVALWRFQPTVVHGDLSAEHVLCSGDAPTAILGWAEAKVADPADDLAWLLVAAPHESVDAILEAYNLRRTELRDPHLTERALLAGELALARWLLHGTRMADQAIIDDAVGMLAELEELTAPAAPPAQFAEGGAAHFTEDDAVAHVPDDPTESAETGEPAELEEPAEPGDPHPDPEEPGDSPPEPEEPDDSPAEPGVPAEPTEPDATPAEPPPPLRRSVFSPVNPDPL